METRNLLTTIDNPFNPFDDFASWYEFDCEKEHFTCSRIARLADIDDEMTQREVEDELERVMNFIVRYDPEEKYMKVHETSAVSESQA